jgi:2-amino-4-hydroxy-6-hydroxymethyldihydropteridine diphosphokinase
MAVCHIALGSNLGDRCANLDAALDKLAERPDLEVTRVSTYYETAPAGGPRGQPEFLNAAAKLSTKLDPFALLRRLQRIEQQLGRRRRARWDARTLDLDLLLYARRTIDDPQLQIPHPRMHFRRFVLEPLSEISPQLRHPGMGWTIRALFENLLRRPLYLALAGPPGGGKRALARRVAQATGARLLCQSDIAFDPSRHDPQLRIQYLETSAGVLDRRRTGECSGWLVSDYWLDQVWLAQQRLIPKSRCQQYARTWQKARADALSPTLVAWLDSPTQTLLERRRDSGAEAEHFKNLVNQERADSFGYIDREHPAPLVRLDGADLDAAERELLAAMQAAAG